MVAACRAAAPLEACGLVAGGVLYQLPNQESREGRFAIDIEDIRAVHDRHGGYDAVWHSHPGGSVEPSSTDRLGHPPGVALVIATPDDVYIY